MSVRTVADIAAGVRAGDLKAADVVEQHLDAIAAREPEIHAFNLVLTDAARQRAVAIDAIVSAGGDPGPLAGVPVALKDNMCTRGVPTTCSSKILDGWVPPYDGTVVSLLGASGAVVVGKVIIVLTAANQFFLYRFLYGTSRATTDDPNQAIIPEMVTNRTNGLARWARWIAIASLIFVVGAGLLRFVDPDPFIPRLWAEIAGSLGTVAVGIGLGAAFSPTDQRRAGLFGVGAGLLAYFVASVMILSLPA